MGGFVSYVDKIFSFLQMLNSSLYSGLDLNQCAKIKKEYRSNGALCHR